MLLMAFNRIAVTEQLWPIIENKERGISIMSVIGHTDPVEFAENRESDRYSPDGPAPQLSAFPKYPASWYLLCPSRELAGEPVARRILGKDLVAFRQRTGDAVVMDGRCAHLGADLGNGKVVGNLIECPFHGWRYGPDGQCRHIPDCGAIPRHARQSVYPAVERNGMLFFFNGPEPLFDLPFFPGKDPEDYVVAPPIEIDSRCSWFMVAAHGFDAQHFEIAHCRRLQAPLKVDCPAEFARRTRYRAEITGNIYSDRILRRVAGPMADTSLTTWGGTIVLVEVEFERASSRFIIFLRPVDDHRTLCQTITYARRAGGRSVRRLVQPLDLWLRRNFTSAYLMAEVERLGNPRYNPKSFVKSDQEMVNFFRWVAALPQTI